MQTAFECVNAMDFLSGGNPTPTLLLLVWLQGPQMGLKWLQKTDGRMDGWSVCVCVDV